MKTVNVLLVEDNPADVELVREALDAAQLEHVMQIATDFEQAKDLLARISAEAAHRMSY